MVRLSERITIKLVHLGRRPGASPPCFSSPTSIAVRGGGRERKKERPRKSKSRIECIRFSLLFLSYSVKSGHYFSATLKRGAR